MAYYIDLSFLRRRPALIRFAITFLTSSLISAVYAFHSPNWYTSTLTVIPSKQSKGSISNLLSSQLGGFAAGLDMGGGADIARIAAVFQSTSISDELIQKLNLRTRYKAPDQELAREVLWKHCSTKLLHKPGLVQLSCEDPEPRFAKQMLECFSELGNQTFSRINTNAAAEETRFLEQHVIELRKQATDAAIRMRDFQEKHHIVDIDTQTKAVVSTLANLNSQRTEKQLELDYAHRFSAHDEASLQQLQAQLSVMDEQLRDLAQPSYSSPQHKALSSESLFPKALAVPRLRAEFESLYRDRKVSEASLVFALERLEAARANQAQNFSTFQILDPPTLPTRKTRPHRLSLILVITTACLALAVAHEWARANNTLPRFTLTKAPSPPDTTA